MLRSSAFGMIIALAFAGAAHSTTITLSIASSDATPAADLDATFGFSFDGIDTLTLTVTNTTTSPNEFNINEIFFNGSGTVTGMTLLTATHSAAGDVFAHWTPVENVNMVNGFGIFDFGLTDGKGENHPSVIGPTESIVFTLLVLGSASGDSDFIVENAFDFVAAAKFVNGPDDPESPGNDDSAFGAAIPEPGTFLLLAGGLLAVGAIRPRQR